MTIRKKGLFWGAGVLGIMLVITFCVIHFAPVYLNSPAVKDRIQAALSRKMGGTVAYERLNVSFFPRPRVTLNQLSFSFPRTFRGTLQSLTFYPYLFPLIEGNVLVSRIQIMQPDFTIRFPALVPEATSELPTLEEVKATIRSVLAYLQAIGPDLVVEMDKGRFVFRKKRQVFLSLQNVSVHFNAPPGDMQILVKAGTEQWGDFSLSTVYDFSETQSEVRDLTVSLGRSSLSNFSAALGWRSNPPLEIRSGRAVLALDQIYQWLSSSESLTPLLKEMTSLKGQLIVESMQGEGPLFDPGKWRWRLTGEAQGIKAESPRIPVPVALNSRFFLEDNLLEVSDCSARLGSSSFSQVAATLIGRNDPVINILRGTAVINLQEVFGWRTRYPALDRLLQGVNSLSGSFSLSSMKAKGPLFRPDIWSINAAGGLDRVVFDSPFFPGPVALMKGTFNFMPDTLSFALQEASILDSTVSGTAVINGIHENLNTIDLTLNGTAGRNTLDWAFDNLELPAELMLKTPVAFSDSHLVWRNTKGLTINGKISIADGPAVFIDLSQQGGEFAIHRLIVSDQHTRASFTLDWQEKSADISFSGILDLATLGRIFKQANFGNGSIHGDLQAVIHTDQPLSSRMKGHLGGENVVIPWDAAMPTMVNKFLLHAINDVLIVDSADVMWGEHHYTATGTMRASDKGFKLNMDLTVDGIEVNKIQQSLSPTKKKKVSQHSRPFPFPQVGGILRVKSSYVKFGRFLFAPARAIVTIGPGEVNMNFLKAGTCGLSVPGTLAISPENIAFDFKPAAEKGQLDSTLNCLGIKDLHITGTYDFKAGIRAQGTGGALLSSLEGSVNLEARDGRIYHAPLLAKIFSVLSVLEIFRGKAPDLGGSGFPYNSMVVSGQVQKGKLAIEKAYIDGKSLDMTAQGEVDLVANKLDLVVLVAPFSTINWIIRNIPLVGKIMGGTLISIPVKVSGDLSNPDVVFLAPSAVGTRLLEILENIVKLPVEIISPILPKDKDLENKK